MKMEASTWRLKCRPICNYQSTILKHYASKHSYWSTTNTLFLGISIPLLRPLPPCHLASRTTSKPSLFNFIKRFNTSSCFGFPPSSAPRSDILSHLYAVTDMLLNWSSYITYLQGTINSYIPNISPVRAKWPIKTYDLVLVTKSFSCDLQSCP